MRRPFAIFTVVSAYTVLEVLLLIGTLGSFNEADLYDTGSTFRRIVYLGQFLLIPGMAALFHFLFYRNHWIRTTLLTVSIGFICFVALVIPWMVFGTIGAWLEPERWWSTFAVLVTTVALSFFLPVFLTRSLRRRIVRLESRRWLAERQLYPNAAERHRHDRTVRWATYVPSTIVLLVFLYLPQVWGLLSHASNPHVGHLRGYDVPTPLTWPVYALPSVESISGFAATSIASGINHYRHFDVPLSFWSVSSPVQSEASDETPSQGRAELGRRTFTLADETLTCIELGKPPELHYSFPARSRYAEINCRSTGPLRAVFFGEREHVDAFYHMLSSITRTAP